MMLTGMGTAKHGLPAHAISRSGMGCSRMPKQLCSVPRLHLL